MTVSTALSIPEWARITRDTIPVLVAETPLMTDTKEPTFLLAMANPRILPKIARTRHQ